MKSAECYLCKRRIGLSKHGAFHRHMIHKGEICKGSWKWPHELFPVTQTESSHKIKDGES